MNTYEVAQAIRQLELNVTSLTKQFEDIKRANPRKHPTLAIRKMQRVANFSKASDTLIDDAERLMMHANSSQKLWVGDSAMNILTMLQEAKGIILAEQEIVKRSEVE